jgi:hypothetical protein
LGQNGFEMLALLVPVNLSLWLASVRLWRAGAGGPLESDPQVFEDPGGAGRGA